MEAITINTTIKDVPKADMDLVRTFAVRDGRGPSDASTFRAAVVELAKRIRKDEDDRKATQ